MNTKEKSLLIGLSLGDGHLYSCKNKNCKTYNSGISFTHSIKQKEYLEWKSKLLHSIFGGKMPNVICINNNGYPGVVMKKSHKYFRVLKRYLYRDTIKTIPLKALNRLTPEAIAIWWMDDGALIPKKRNGKIHAWELYLNTYLSDDENQIIIDYFKDKWDITWKLNHCKGKSRLRCSTQEGRKFLNIIREIVNEVSCMRYKVINI